MRRALNLFFIDPDGGFEFALFPSFVFLKLAVDPTGHLALASASNADLAFQKFESRKYIFDVSPFVREIRNQDRRSVPPLVDFKTWKGRPNSF